MLTCTLLRVINIITLAGMEKAVWPGIATSPAQNKSKMIPKNLCSSFEVTTRLKPAVDPNWSHIHKPQKGRKAIESLQFMTLLSLLALIILSGIFRFYLFTYSSFILQANIFFVSLFQDKITIAFFPPPPPLPLFPPCLKALLPNSWKWLSLELGRWLTGSLRKELLCIATPRVGLQTATAPRVFCNSKQGKREKDAGYEGKHCLSMWEMELGLKKKKGRWKATQKNQRQIKYFTPKVVISSKIIIW